MIKNNGEVKVLNQILSVDNGIKEKGKKNKTGNSGPMEISSILKFFSIAILMFGLFMIGTGSYSMYKNANEESSNTKPVIEVNPIDDTAILLKVTHNKELDQVTYTWNDEDGVEVPCSGRKEVQTQIQIPTGTNVLNVYASDVNGKEIEYQRAYTLAGGIEINIEPQGNNLLITADSEKELLYMTYRWDEEEEKTVEINDVHGEETIEIPKGLHTLTVIAVDEDNQTETKEQEVNGVTRPEVDVTTDDQGNFTIKTSDEEGVKKIEFTLNGENYFINLDKVLPLENRKEFEYSYQLQDGTNNLKVTVYNENDVSGTFESVFEK